MASHVSRRKPTGSSSSKSRETPEIPADESKNIKRHVGTRRLAVGILIVVFFGSVLRENDMVPDSYFSDKHNPLNQRFVKWSWGWTLCTLVPYLMLLSWARAPGKVVPAIRGLLRLLTLSAVWYFWVEIVMFTVHEWTGKCTVGSHGDSKACRRGGGRWDGFDISGHCFLLILIILTSHEELGPFWHLFETSGVKFRFPTGKQEMKELPIISSLLENLVYLFVIIISLMQSLSIIMVIATSLYFHTISHKIIGSAIAVLSWFVTYRLWFNSNSSLALPLF